MSDLIRIRNALRHAFLLFTFLASVALAAFIVLAVVEVFVPGSVYAATR